MSTLLRGILAHAGAVGTVLLVAGFLDIVAGSHRWGGIALALGLGLMGAHVGSPRRVSQGSSGLLGGIVLVFSGLSAMIFASIVIEVTAGGGFGSLGSVEIDSYVMGMLLASMLSIPGFGLSAIGLLVLRPRPRLLWLTAALAAPGILFLAFLSVLGSLATALSAS